MSRSQRTEELLQGDLDHIIRPGFIVGEHTEVVIDSAHGVYVVDTEGKEYLDVSSQLMCSNLGHGRKEIQDAIINAVSKTDYTTLFFGYCSSLSVECGRKLAEVTPGDLNHFYFTSGGSESVDTAIKIARLFWHSEGKSTKYKIISLDTSYHGLAGISTSATGLGRGSTKVAFGPDIGGFQHVPSYYCYRCAFNREYPDCDMVCARFLKHVVEMEGPDRIAAFIGEPIQGSGGVIDPPPEYWPIVSEICREHDILLIADEVMTGFARTGKMFACEHYGIQPQMMTMAKGISGSYVPFGAVAVSDEVYGGLKGKPFPHGFTNCGHPLGCAATIAALDVYVREKIVDNAARVGAHIKERLDSEFLPLPCVGNIGGKGMFQALELVSDKESKKPISADVRAQLETDLREAGIFSRVPGVNGNRLVLSPPCVTTMEEADQMLDIIKPIVAALAPE
jgi:adenosylmethionine-8-amino-7-oxononanoate aminotransferase